MSMPQPQPSEGSPPDLVRVRRRQSRSVETRSRILEAATAVFAAAGFEGASTRMIAERADVRHALLIYHFQTKRGLWETVMRRVVDTFQTTFRNRLDGLDGVDDVIKLRSLQADFIRLAAAHPELHWLMSHEAGERGDRIDWIVDNLLGENFTTFANLIRSAQAQGRYVEGDAIHLHYVFLGAAARIFMLSGEVEKVTGHSSFDPAFVEEHIVVCERLFFRDAPAGRRSAGKRPLR